MLEYEKDGGQASKHEIGKWAERRGGERNRGKERTRNRRRRSYFLIVAHLGIRVKSRQSSVSVILVPGTMKEAARLFTSVSSSTPQPWGRERAKEWRKGKGARERTTGVN